MPKRNNLKREMIDLWNIVSEILVQGWLDPVLLV